jgi:hypothetical protein
MLHKIVNMSSLLADARFSCELGHIKSPQHHWNSMMPSASEPFCYLPGRTGEESVEVHTWRHAKDWDLFSEP